MRLPRWPWQSVVIADVIERRRVSEVSQLQADLASQEDATAQAMRLFETERRRYDELLATVFAMKAQGAVVVPTPNGVVQPEAPIQRPTDPLHELIADQCGDDVRKRAMMLRQLKIDRAAKVPEEDIRAAIINGVQSVGVP